MPLLVPSTQASDTCPSCPCYLRNSASRHVWPRYLSSDVIAWPRPQNLSIWKTKVLHRIFKWILHQTMFCLHFHRCILAVWRTTRLCTVLEQVPECTLLGQSLCLKASKSLTLILVSLRQRIIYAVQSRQHIPEFTRKP